MKTNKLYKFALTAVCAAVLTACGGSSGPNAQDRQQIEQNIKAAQENVKTIDTAKVKANEKVSTATAALKAAKNALGNATDAEKPRAQEAVDRAQAALDKANADATKINEAKEQADKALKAAQDNMNDVSKAQAAKEKTEELANGLPRLDDNTSDKGEESENNNNGSNGDGDKLKDGSSKTDVEKKDSDAQMQGSENAFTSFQHMKKNESKLGSDNNAVGSESTFLRVDNQQLNPNLDTIVVAQTKDNSTFVYLDNFKFSPAGADDLYEKVNEFEGIKKVKGDLSSLDDAQSGNVKDVISDVIEKVLEDNSNSDDIGANFTKVIETYNDNNTDKDQKLSTVMKVLEAVKQIATNDTVWNDNSTNAKKDFLKRIFLSKDGNGLNNLNEVTSLISNPDETKIKTDKMQGVIDIVDGMIKDVAPIVLTSERTDGFKQMSNIYYGVKETVGNQQTQNTVAPSGDAEGATHALVYEEGRNIYFTVDNQTKVDNLQEHLSKSPKFSADKNNVRYLGTVKDDNSFKSGSVAEVYGNKTFAYELNGELYNDAGNNAPLAKKVNENNHLKYEGGRFEHVQYGRVTSAMSDLDPSKLKDGLVAKTKVGVYGAFGNKDTENTYFARGTDRLTDKNKLPEGKLTYYGHAVSYGLDNTYPGPEASGPSSIPNAVSKQKDNNYGLWSGNHVTAEIDVGHKLVNGSIYNVWSDGNAENTKKVDLVTFRGGLGANGNIIGTATAEFRNDDNDGEFKAGLFGEQGKEMAGTVKSNTKDADKAWGAVFGAYQEGPKASPAPNPPSNEDQDPPENPWVPNIGGK